MRKPVAVEIIHVWSLACAQAVAVGLAIATAALWILYLGGRLPELPV